jgi:hypothetical protein
MESMAVPLGAECVQRTVMSFNGTGESFLNVESAFAKPPWVRGLCNVRARHRGERITVAWRRVGGQSCRRTRRREQTGATPARFRTRECLRLLRTFLRASVPDTSDGQDTDSGKWP